MLRQSVDFFLFYVTYFLSTYNQMYAQLNPNKIFGFEINTHARDYFSQARFIIVSAVCLLHLQKNERKK